MASCEKILIAGFSGAGKSSLLLALKPKAPENWELFDDLDHLIMKKHGKSFESLGALIEGVGWDKFRLLERQELEGWLKEEGRGVLSLGGGTLSPLVLELFGKNRKIKFCYLKAPFEISWTRLLGDTTQVRPLVALGKNKLQELFEERKKVFEQIPWQMDATQSLGELSSQFWSKIISE